MKLRKTLSITVMAAIAAMAFMGASAAQASDTVLCKVESESLACPEGQETTEFHLSAQATIVLTSLVNYKCAGTLFTGTLLGLGSPQVGHITEFVFTECESESGAKCSFSPVSLGTVEFNKTAPNEAQVILSSLSLQYICGKSINCTYGATEIFPTILHGLGASPGNHGEVLANKVVLVRQSGLLCPKEVRWDALYEFLEDTYIRS